MSCPVSQSLLILDVDETLIHATNEPLSVPYDFKAGPYFVYKRPHLGAFLDAVSSAFQIAVWSSSTADYLVTICDQIIPPRIELQFTWARDRCVQQYDPEWQSSYWVKDLKKVKRLGYNLDRVIFVDDTPKKLERNYGNAVYIESFTGDVEDRELELLAPFLVSLADSDNVRVLEKRGWRYPGK